MRRRRRIAATRTSRRICRTFPVTDDVLKNPDAADWLMYSRTYDAQRFSPLDQINRSNVGTLERAWSKPLAAGPLEIIPIVYRGVMYLTTPGGRDGREPRVGARCRDRRSHLGVRAGGHGRVAGQGARDLRGHDLLHGARRSR